MRYEILKVHASLSPAQAAQPKKPSITGMTRLETQPTTVGLLAGLQAPLADPLWLLARQWQFNEFQGEDAGTPLDLSFEIEGTRVDAFRPGTDRGGDGAGAQPGAGPAPWQPLRDGESAPPLEARVEAESAWASHARLRGESGQHALRMAAAPLRAALLAAYPLALPPPSDPQADRAGQRWSALMHGRAVDGARLAAELRALQAADGTLAALPAALAPPLDGADAEAARTVLAAWLRWHDALLVEGAGSGDAAGASASWQKHRLEYAFALRAGATRLDCDEYTDGHLDWDDFVARDDGAGPAGGDGPPVPERHAFAVASRLPSPVRYPGMPAERFWEFEDGAVNFAGAEAGVTDLLRLCVTEFALTFGNDWFMVPVRLPVGFLHRVVRLRITDSFGVPSSPRPLDAGDDRSRWTLYALAADGGGLRDGHTLFLPDSVDGVHEGAELERTTLARDEMANLAWAIEHTVQGASGEPLDRALEAQALAFQQRIDFDADGAAGAAASPQLVYRLQTPVPANWTPLLPVRDPGLALADPLAIRLARAGMQRFYPLPAVAVIGDDDPAYAAFVAHLRAQTAFIDSRDIDAGLLACTFHPRGRLLRSDPLRPLPSGDTLLVEEEEVPRTGVTLQRTFQYARTSDGRAWLWVGRRKTAGRGEAASGLRHDVAVRRETLR